MGLETRPLISEKKSDVKKDAITRKKAKSPKLKETMHVKRKRDSKSEVWVGLYDGDLKESKTIQFMPK